jgi:hypothetical protein
LLAAGRRDLVAGLHRHGHDRIRLLLGLPEPDRKQLRKVRKRVAFGDPFPHSTCVALLCLKCALDILAMSEYACCIGCRSLKGSSCGRCVGGIRVVWVRHAERC